MILEIQAPKHLESRLQKYLKNQAKKFIQENQKEKIKPEVERSWYKDPDNPKRFDYDVIEKEFTNADEAVSFLRDYYV